MFIVVLETNSYMHTQTYSISSFIICIKMLFVFADQSVTRTETAFKANNCIFLSLCYLSSQRLKTKESNIPECWRRFKLLAFSSWSYQVILAQNMHPKSNAVLLVWVAQWIKKAIPEFFKLLFCWLIDSLRIKIFF